MPPTYYRKDARVQDVQGQALAGTLVYVLNQPSDFSTVPPSPLANLFANSDGTAGILPNPVVADGTGNVFYYAAPNFYTEVYVFRGAVSQILVDQMVGVSSGGGGGSGVGVVTTSNLLGAPDPGAIVLLFTAVDPTVFPVNFANPQSYGNLPITGRPTAPATYNVQNNGLAVGSVTVAPSGIFTFSSPGFQMNPGDLMSVTAPSPADPTLANVAISFAYTTA